MMIDLTRIEPAGERALKLTFSDGSHGPWTADAEIARDTVMTRPLADPAYFARAFIEAGALAWPGLEFAAHSLHADMEAAGVLVRRAA
jgi:hypothetical protein